MIVPVNPDILRICDANCNRAREAFRVLEDYVRFSLNNADLSESLKTLRHDFQTATQTLQRNAVAHRDTAHDVGTGITTESEQKRESLGAVVTAASKRLGEALRTIEEYTKTTGGASAQVQSIRYRYYDVEKRLLLTLTPGRDKMRGVRLCVLVTEALCKHPWLDVARLAIEGGADCLQLREKHFDGAELLKRAHQFAALCRQHNVISIINDRVDIAVLSHADGVHVGQTDIPATEVRKLIGPDRILGVSTQRIEQARQAVLDGADYIGVGPIFTSTTKPKDALSGLDYARQIPREIAISAIAISGINSENLSQLLETGLESVAVSASVISSGDPKLATKELKARLVG